MPEVTPLCGALGARITGLDLARPLDEAAVDRVREAFARHLVLVFPDQALPPARQSAFTRIFGPPEPHPLRTRPSVPGHPEVLILENRPGRRGARNDYWHSDISHAERPPLASVLHAIEVPEGRGDTMFCNMVAARAALSEGLRAALAPLRALHSAAATLRRNNAEASDGRPIDEAEIPAPRPHPVMRCIPETGERALFVNPHFTVAFEDMTPAESAPLLGHLYRVATRPENVYRHRWRAGDVLLWDNRRTMHYAVRDYDETMVRRLHRTTAGGERPV